MRTRCADRHFMAARGSSPERLPVKWAGAVAILSFAAFGLWVACYHFGSRVAGVLGAYGELDSSSSPYATAADFTRYVVKLCDGAVLRTRPIAKFPAQLRTPWKLNIVTTIFWIGEPAGPNNPVSNERSSWDFNWTVNYGGSDPPEAWNRRNYIPMTFTPRQNPFYVALPYNDVTHGEFKPEAPLVIPWFRRAYTAPGQSVCKDRWIAIRRGSRICYAQWEDCGPFRTDNFQYVFGNERPAPNANGGAGLDVSPAVRDYLGLQGMDVTDWQFVDAHDVPQGPWRGHGDNNPFVTGSRQTDGQLTKEQGAGNESRTANTVRGN